MQDIHSRAWLRTNAWRYPPAVWESIHSDRCNFVLDVDNVELSASNVLLQAFICETRYPPRERRLASSLILF